MNWLYSLINLIVTPADWLGLAALVVPVLGALGYLIYRTGSIVTIVERMEPQVAKIAGMEVRVEELWRQKITTSASPMILNDVGIKILENSKIFELTDKYYDKILEKIRFFKPENPFQAQEMLIAIVSEYKDVEECRLKLQEASYNSGYDIVTVLFVAALNIRDKVIEDLGFNRDDIDKHDPSKKVDPFKLQ